MTTHTVEETKINLDDLNRNSGITRPEPTCLTLKVDNLTTILTTKKEALAKIEQLKKTKFQFLDKGDQLHDAAIFAYEQQNGKVDYAQILHQLELARLCYQKAYSIEQTIISMIEKQSSEHSSTATLSARNYPDRLSNIESLQRIVKVQLQSQNARRVEAYAATEGVARTAPAKSDLVLNQYKIQKNAAFTAVAFKEVHRRKCNHLS